MGGGEVRFDGVWKKFRRGERHDSLRDLIPALARRLLGRGPVEGDLGAEEFWALRDVSFVVGHGEALGIIGANGAGKSTALKLLTRILRPTRGRSEIRGRTGALIEVAAGFHPDLTGRENVYLQGSIMGMKRAEIAAKFEAIVEFSGVREFIDTPVKRYSSGMNARLGFSIAAHLDPDVLIIDEVLSVGDMAFQDRCLQRMQAMRASGMPLVFVSHNLQAVRDLCTRALVLERGKVAFDGPPLDAVQHYRKALAGRAQSGGGSSADASAGEIHIAGVELLGDGGAPSEWFRCGGPLTVRIAYDAPKPTQGPHVVVDVHSAEGVHCFGAHTRTDRVDLGLVEGLGRIDFCVDELPLLEGSYALSVHLVESDCSRTIDTHRRAYPFSVRSEGKPRGFVEVRHRWQP